MSEEEKFKIALFMIIRNSQVFPKGFVLNKTIKEINKMSYETMLQVLKMIDFEEAKKIYQQGKNAFEEG